MDSLRIKELPNNCLHSEHLLLDESMTVELVYSEEISDDAGLVIVCFHEKWLNSSLEENTLNKGIFYGIFPFHH